MAQLFNPELPYQRQIQKESDRGVGDTRQEIAREPQRSSHYASPVRTQIMKTLGLKESGFFADWRKRTLSPSYQDDGQAPLEDTTATNLKGPDFKPFGQQAITAQLPEKAPGKSQFQPTQDEQLLQDSATGLTRYQLHQTELGIIWSQVRGKIEQNPILSTDVLDTMAANTINMDRQVAMNLTANPMKLLGQAQMEYFMKLNKPAIEQTNFEKIVSKYSETKNIAMKNINYAGAEMGKKIAQLQKNPTYPGAANMLNIGKTGGYNPTYYSPPL